MTITESGARPTPSALRPTRRRIVFGLLALTLIVGFGRAYWIWTHPNLFADQGIEGVVGPVPVSHAVEYAAVAFGPDRPSQDETITLHSVTAHFKTNSAHAIATFTICDSNQPGSSITDLAAPESPDKYCRLLRPVINGMKVRLRYDGPRNEPEYMLMTLRATTAGTAHVDWVTIDYSRSWRHLGQHGSDRSKQDWIVKATA